MLEIHIKSDSWDFSITGKNDYSDPLADVGTRIIGLETVEDWETNDKIATAIYNAVHGGVALSETELSEDCSAQFVVTLNKLAPGKLSELDVLVQGATKMIRDQLGEFIV